MRILVGFLLFAAADPPNLTLHLPSRVEAFRGSGQWQEVQLGHQLDPKQTLYCLSPVSQPPRESSMGRHQAGTELVIQHIEKYWAPAMLSKDLLAALR